jgi:hypothetical protein
MQKTTLIILALVIVGLLVANKFLKNQQQEQPEEEPLLCPEYEKGWSSDSDAVPEVLPELDLTEIIKLGDYSEGVLYAQQRINSQYGGAIAEDGKFGCETFYAVENLTGYDAVEGFELNDLK